MSQVPRTNAGHDQNRTATLLGVSSADGKTPVPVEVDPNTGALLVSTGRIVPEQFDYVAYTNTNGTTDTYVYKLGGASGTTIATVTIVYTDSTKTQPSTITRT